MKSAVNSSNEGTNVEKTENSFLEYYDDEKATVGKSHGQIK